MKKSSHRSRNLLINVGLFGAVLLVCLGLGEIALRLTVNANDIIEPVLLTDSHLRQRLAPHSAGHDAWGFRNPAVPDQADIVILGDSQTYGVNAFMTETWPAVVGKLTGKSVYNLAMGSYGPAQYYFLLQQEAMRLNPSMIIVGLYFGNDIFDSYDMAHQVAAWQSWIRPEFGNAGDRPRRGRNEIWDGERILSNSWRHWAEEHSFMYRLIVRDLLKRLDYQIKKRSADPRIDITITQHPTLKYELGFTPRLRLVAVDTTSAKMVEGLAITCDLLDSMQVWCAEHKMDFVVALLPTKESIFARYDYHRPELKNSAELDRLIDCERWHRDRIAAHLTGRGIEFVDCLPDLQKAADTQRIFPASKDGHPNKFGYAVIAQTVADYLQKKPPAQAP